ncbi:metal-dependent hydrolase [Thermoflexus sp.]|uniref:metal-dependent hydrolase n=2 Tax=Thermoflexus sp. TaxID=1969742 RepID=UPI0025DD7CEE|nr:metal-dependent hydrolase [Thermoflexus sp.]MCS7350947.1 metal-dependent hydrolase [Thermoflexus sp.]MCX7691427.1 metal-dependent hydrolase [Thermoflexus sp.]MDW8180398.1 metal-dependent hydrolase [Anaerolineae bacterium]MDW8185237.1 metal-dependent hydrolase [Anaerolineae bacterium]
MQLRTHIVIGAAIGLWVGGPIGGALGAFAGVVPDVDLDVGSVARGARWLGVIGIAGGALGGYLLNSPTIAGLSIAGGFLLLMLIRLPHRGPTHSLALALLWSLLGGLWLRDPGLIGAWAAGYLSHLFLDALTPQGIPWLWPLSGGRLRLARWRTGSLWDHAILILGGLIGVGWIGWKMVG